MSQIVHINVARRYLCELILLNEKYKSDLQDISEEESVLEEQPEED